MVIYDIHYLLLSMVIYIIFSYWLLIVINHCSYYYYGTDYLEILFYLWLLS